MPNYRRHYYAGWTYFFTVNLLQRYENDLFIRDIDDLRQAIRTVKATHPFDILALAYCTLRWLALKDGRWGNTQV